MCDVLVVGFARFGDGFHECAGLLTGLRKLSAAYVLLDRRFKDADLQPEP